jgi:biopolymer transport protein ExbD
MIDRPKRSVTRFFVPLIDVLILLFCIFLLMPFVSSDSAEPDAASAKNKLKEELPKDVKQLQAELEKARREVEKLKSEKGNLAERLSLKVLKYDPERGGLYYLQDGQREYVTKDAEAENLITIHKRASGTKDPFFLIEYPRNNIPPQEMHDNYKKWFKGVEFQIYVQ